MQIIDNYKDYYDFNSHVYGIDKKVRFDRRESVKIINSSLIEMAIYDDRRVRDSFLLLETGYVQYLISVSNIQQFKHMYCNSYTGTMMVVKQFRDYKHHYGSAISLRGVMVHSTWNWRRGLSCERIDYTDSYENLIEHTYRELNLPILKDTKITGLIDSFVIWSDIQNYISSLNNDKTVDNMTNKERIDSHGFDKHSFRSN